MIHRGTYDGTIYHNPVNRFCIISVKTADILKVMTLEQAQQVVVDDGICRGMTIAQVAEKRPVNLRYYLIPGKSKNNMVRAAAQLVLDSLQKAG